jgi:raffinose/stachyose/melibiose transport system substrate-binding protein
MKKIFFVLLVAALLASCTNATPTTAPSNPTTAPASPTTASAVQPTTAKQVVIRWWHVQPETAFAAYWQSEADKYMAAHPNVKIEITTMSADDFKTKLATQMAAGDPPDLFHTWDGGTLKPYIDAGMVKDITSWMAADNNAWQKTFTSAIESCNYAGKYYCATWDVPILGVWYNKALFQQAGIASTPKTWTEFLDAVNKLKAAGITPMAVGAKDRWPAHFIYTYLILRNGGTAGFKAAVSGSGKFTDAPFVTAGEQLQQLLALNPYQDGFLGASFNDEVALIGNGKAAMDVMGSWAPTAEIQAATDGGAAIKQNLGFFPFPTVDNGKEQTAVIGVVNGFAVGKNAPDETVDFLKFLTSADEQRIRVTAGLALPSVTGIDDAIPDTWMKEAFAAGAAAESFQLVYDQALSPAVAQAVLDATEGLFGGTLTPQQAAQMMEDAMAKER